MAFFGHMCCAWDCEFPPTPLVRHFEKNDGESCYAISSSENRSAYGQVRRWKVLISTFSPQHFDAYISSALVEFCKMMNTSSPPSVEVSIIPRNMEGVEDPATHSRVFHDINMVLRPLQLLRNLPAGALTFRDAKKDDVHSAFISHNSSSIGASLLLITSQLPDSVACKQLILSAESSNPVEYVTAMYPSLIQYAQTFERFVTFKVEMGLPAEGWPSREMLSFHGIRVWRRTHNPFRQPTLHPVEQALSEASRASYVETLELFREVRARVLKYLEPQYHRIVAAYSEMTAFIRRVGGRIGLLELCPDQEWLDQDLASEATILLEQLAAAFVRDSPIYVRVEIKKYRQGLDKYYYSHNREGALASLDDARDRRDGFYF